MNHHNDDNPPSWGHDDDVVQMQHKETQSLATQVDTGAQFV